MGHSGSGKSTIANLLMKYITPTNGKIKVDGVDISEIDTSGILGCVNQFEHVFSDSFLNNVTVYGAYPGENLNNITDYYSCNKIDLIKEKNDCTELSGGEKQLLSLVKMMLINRDIIILDEPFSSLDFQNSILMQEKVYGLKDKTMIVITHNLSEKNLNYFDEVIIMNNGYIEKSGSTTEIMESIEYSKLIKTA
ncbi:ABC transporter ATP-binding protein [Sporosalibacterium faouarense]|uniref:ABC transporter ATP-binding protein n=1 Tax=Sporosalibacterium faouarense TaxID=516123 RepID=UPI00311CA41E